MAAPEPWGCSAGVWFCQPGPDTPNPAVNGAGTEPDTHQLLLPWASFGPVPSSWEVLRWNSQSRNTGATLCPLFTLLHPICAGDGSGYAPVAALSTASQPAAGPKPFSYSKPQQDPGRQEKTFSVLDVHWKIAFHGILRDLWHSPDTSLVSQRARR